MAHTAGCYCIAIDPLGRYFAVGSADSLVTLWGISEMLCVLVYTLIISIPIPGMISVCTFLRLPVRTISFNNTGEYLASASEDLFIEIVPVANGSGSYPFSVDVPRNTRFLFSNKTVTQAKAIAKSNVYLLKPGSSAQEHFENWSTS
ncbi:THO complex subunit 3-like [Prunus persica]|uniref:THO complex subunit 3-like n=1 Tax=Prunus persica TaxID=3760 RepID=UPI0009AB6C30|nr:THO complex subunit 3-like [Prunus persica]